MPPLYRLSPYRLSPYRLATSTLALLLVLSSPSTKAETRHATDPDSGAETWETRAHGVNLQLTQILPDQARAFYLNRGFSAEAAERYAMACVYMTVLRNDAAPGEVGFRLADWRVAAADRERPPLQVEEWMAIWKELKLPEQARIAFRWSQFPPEQEYAQGEWNQGMLTTGLPAGGRFDLIARWSVAGRVYEGKLEGVRCAR